LNTIHELRQPQKKSWSRSIIADIIGLTEWIDVGVGDWRTLKSWPYRTPHYTSPLQGERQNHELGNLLEETSFRKRR
jgi:hypothetical protein